MFWAEHDNGRPTFVAVRYGYRNANGVAGFVWSLSMGGFQGERKSSPPPKKDMWVVALQKTPTCTALGAVLRSLGTVRYRRAEDKQPKQPAAHLTYRTPSSQLTPVADVADGNHTAKYSPMYRKSPNYSDQSDICVRSLPLSTL